MTLFFVGLAILAGGYLVYGKLVERLLGVDDRETPAVRLRDGVDYLVLPTWRDMLIQLLNIAGIGPIIGVIIGVKYGADVFLIIPVGCILGGAVHDFLAGFMSLREDGKNLPFITRKYLGPGASGVFSVMLSLALLLVVAVFINVPAGLIKDGLCRWQGIETAAAPAHLFWIPAAAIFVYYVLATLLPVNKIIGRFYPLFGIALLVGTAALLVAALWRVFHDPSLLAESAAFRQAMFTPANHHPIVPTLFVTIACGILSGFHATQSPIIARTLRSELAARKTFYGMMVVEGVIAMIWAAATLAIFNLRPELMTLAPMPVLSALTSDFLGTAIGSLTIFSVIILAVTSGDTAMRCLRLSVAEALHFPQMERYQRIAVTLPLIFLTILLLLWSNGDAASFNKLWNYFGWGNQVIASVTLLTAVVWLVAHRRNPWIAIVPGVFITFVVVTYILWVSPAHGGPYGGGLELNLAYAIAGPLTAALFVWGWLRGRRAAMANEPDLAKN
ncbi:MAG: carbon starvation protein A [Planctomycetes bacterium]|nr:carbon starvation protein A [Planctomycetota bacterium]